MRSRSQILIAKISAMVAALLLGGGLVWLASQPSEYSSRAQVGFFPIVGDRGLIPGSETVVLATNNYLSVVESPQTLASVAEATGIDAETLDGGMSATVTPGSATVAISVTTQDGQESALAANEFAAELLAAAKGDRIVVARLLAGADAAENPTGPPRVILAALILALSIGAFVVVWQLLLLATAIRSAREQPASRDGEAPVGQ